VVARDTAHQLKRNKFQRSVWKLVDYSTLFIFGFYVTVQQEWSFDRFRYFEDPNPFPASMRTYYMLEIAHYIYATATIFWEPKQTDLWQMLLHHVATLILLFGSYSIACYRIGAMLLLITDFTDPILEMAKINIYGGCQTLGDHLFTLFGVSFIILRLLVYPYAIVYPAIYAWDHVPYAKYLIPFLWILQLIFIYWCYVILSIAYKMAMGEAASDIREE